MLSSGLDENWQPPCSSCVRLKPGCGGENKLGYMKLVKWSLLMRQVKASFFRTCDASVAGRHVEAVLLMGGVGVGVSGDAANGRLVHPVGVSEVEAALKGALVFWEM